MTDATSQTGLPGAQPRKSLHVTDARTRRRNAAEARFRF